MSLIYPAGDEQVTPNIGLATWGMDEVLAENMILIDAAIGGPTDSIKINGSVVPATNFINSASVTFSVVGSNVSATATSAGSAAWSSLTGALSNGQVIPYGDAGISRLGAASLAIGNGTAASIVGTLTLGSLIVSAVSGATHPFKIIDIGTGFAGVDLGGGTTNPALYGTSSQTILNASSQVFLEVANAPKVFAFSTGVGLSSGPLIWSSTLNANGTADTGISRLGAASLAIGNGTAGDVTGQLHLHDLAFGATGTSSFITAATQGIFTFGTSTGDNSGALYAKVFRAYDSGATPQFDVEPGGARVEMGSGIVLGWGSASATSALDTGFSRLGAASLAIGNGTAGDVTGSMSANRYFAAAIGTIAAPQYSFLSNTNYGMFLDGNNAVSFTVTGIERLAIDGVGAVVRSDGVYGWANAGLYNARDAGISRLGAGSLAIGNGTTGDTTGALTAANITVGTKLTANVISSTVNPMLLQIGINTVAKVGTNLIELGSNGVFTWNPQTDLSGGTNDTGISRLGPASLAIGTQTQGNTTGNLSLNRINKAGADFAGQATVTAGNTTQAVTFAANYAGTGQPVIVLTPTSDPLAAGLPVGYWVTYSGGAGAWSGFTVNIQTALAGDITFNYIVVGVA